jgi:uncharacterized protein
MQHLGQKKQYYFSCTMTFVRSYFRLALPALLTFGLSCSPGWTAEQQQRMLSVTGRGTTEIPATLTEISLGIEVTGLNATTVQQDVANRATQVLQLLRQRQVSKLKTSYVTLTPNYSGEANSRRIVSYTATNSLTFRAPVTQAGAIIDQAIKNGASKVDRISSVPEDAAIDQAQILAIQLATKDAQRQATSALSSLGLQQKAVVGIQINNASRPVPASYGNLNRSSFNNKVTEIVGGEQEVEASVTLQISY